MAGRRPTLWHRTSKLELNLESLAPRGIPVVIHAQAYCSLFTRNTDNTKFTSLA